MSWSLTVAGEAEDVRAYVEQQDEQMKKYGNDCAEWRASRDAILALCDRVVAGRPNQWPFRQGVYAKAYGHCDSTGGNATLEASIIDIGLKEAPAASAPPTTPTTPTPATSSP